MVILLLSIYFLWSSVIPEGTRFLGYEQSEMLTYILATVIVSSVVLSNRSQDIGDEINKGNLSNYLLRPINYFGYWFSRDMGDKIMNVLFSIVEFGILIAILKPPLFIQTDLFTILLFIVVLLLAVVLYFFINVTLGLIGFWSPEVWAPRFIFWVTLGFFAGSYFPIDILPKSMFKLFELLPFSYLIYFPIKIYLGQLGSFEILRGMLILTAWIGISFAFLLFVWRKGLRVYTAQGR